MLFYSYFKTLVGKEVTVELKNDLAIAGTLHSVDQYLNLKLENTSAFARARVGAVGGGTAVVFLFKKHTRGSYKENKKGS